MLAAIAPVELNINAIAATEPATRFNRATAITTPLKRGQHTAQRSLRQPLDLTWRREWDFAELGRRGVLVLQPDDPSDSYAIVRSSRAVVTCGSTIGIEAAYLGVPNAVVGNWVGGRLGASVETNNAGDLTRFLAKPRLMPKARERALLFGSFYKSAGKLLPELDVGAHPNLVRIDGRIVDRVRYPLQKLRFLMRGRPDDPGALDVRSGTQAGRVVLATGTDYRSAFRQPVQGSAAISGVTKPRLAATEKSRSLE